MKQVVSKAWQLRDSLPEMSGLPEKSGSGIC